MDCIQHEIWDECGMVEHCQDTCPVILGQKPPPVCFEKCTASCVCIDGYVRTSENNRTCIPKGDCGTISLLIN